MIAWYGQVLGTQVVFENEVSAWLSNDRANHRIALLAFPAYRDDPAKDLHTGLHHTAFEFASFDDLMATFARLKAAGIEPAFCLDHGMAFSLYYFDPDRNGVELQIDVFGDWNQSAEWMRSSPQFRANPIGVFFNPDQVLAGYKAGLSFDELRSRVLRGEYLPDPLPNLIPEDPA